MQGAQLSPGLSILCFWEDFIQILDDQLIKRNHALLFLELFHILAPHLREKQARHNPSHLLYPRCLPARAEGTRKMQCCCQCPKMMAGDQPGLDSYWTNIRLLIR